MPYSFFSARLPFNILHKQSLYGRPPAQATFDQARKGENIRAIWHQIKAKDLGVNVRGGGYEINSYGYFGAGGYTTEKVDRLDAFKWPSL